MTSAWAAVISISPMDRGSKQDDRVGAGRTRDDRAQSVSLSVLGGDREGLRSMRGLFVFPVTNRAGSIRWFDLSESNRIPLPFRKMPAFPIDKRKLGVPNEGGHTSRRPKAIGAPVRPYDLRHSFVSLLINEGVSIAEVARQAGHSPQTCWSTYTHVFDEFDPEHRFGRGADQASARADPPAESAACRGGWLVLMFPRCSRWRRAPKPSRAHSARERKPGVGLEPTTPSLPWKCSTN